MVELLAVKKGDSYIRFLGDGFETCTMSKASVYPLAQKDVVKELLGRHKAHGLSDAILVKLTIQEEVYDLPEG